MNLFYTFDLLGTAAFAASGALAGIRRDMDAVCWCWDLLPLPRAAAETTKGT